MNLIDGFIGNRIRHKIVDNNCIRTHFENFSCLFCLPCYFHRVDINYAQVEITYPLYLVCRLIKVGTLRGNHKDATSIELSVGRLFPHDGIDVAQRGVLGVLYAHQPHLLAIVVANGDARHSLAVAVCCFDVIVSRTGWRHMNERIAQWLVCCEGFFNLLHEMGQI